jgi:GNAT superfamily N-acetyltransferase
MLISNNTLYRIVLPSIFSTFLLTSLSIFAEIRYEIHRGPLSKEHVEMLKHYDPGMWYDYPYLLAATPEYEEEYWHEVSTPSTILVLAYNKKNNFAGAVVAYSVNEPGGHVGDFYAPGKNLYISWVGVLKEYQRKGIARKLMAMCESEAEQQKYTDAYLMTVVRSEGHPMKTENATNLDAVFSRLGYKPMGVYKVWNWPTRCSKEGKEYAADIDNMVKYWRKTFTQNSPQSLSPSK